MADLIGSSNLRLSGPLLCPSPFSYILTSYVVSVKYGFAFFENISAAAE
jgi:hypothetical protein